MTHITHALKTWAYRLYIYAVALVTRYRARNWRPPPMEADLDFGRFSGRGR